MHRGYIKLWRKSLESQIWNNQNVWRVWTWCLLKATHCDRIGTVGLQEISLSPGQFIYGRTIAAKETGLSEQKIRSAINYLVSHQNLTIKVTNKFSIISIVKWSDYQDEVTSNLTNKQPTNNQQITTDKHIKNDKNIKEIYKERFSGYSEDFIKTFNDFKDMRNKIKHPLTERAIDLILGKLDKLATDEKTKVEILNQSILHSWQDVFELKNDNNRQSVVSDPAHKLFDHNR